MQNLNLLCKFSYPWIIIIVLQLTVLVFIALTFWLTNWAEFNGYSVGVIYFKHDSGYFNVLQDVQKQCRLLNNDSLCKKLEDLKLSFQVYLTCIGFFILCTISWIISSISFIKERHLYRLGIVSSLGCILSSTSGFLLWAYTSEASLLNCPSSDSSNSLCLKSGFFINLFSIIGLITFIQIFFILIGKLSLKISKLGYRMTELEDIATRQVQIDNTKSMSISISIEK